MSEPGGTIPALVGKSRWSGRDAEGFTAAAGLPDTGAAAMVTTLRYHWRQPETEYRQDVYADYNLRVAPRLMGGDYFFTSHLAGVHYRVSHGRHKLTEAATVGSIGGRPPQ